MTIPTVNDLPNVPEKNATKGKAVGAAKQFEALLIGQMLKAMRESGSGWLGSGEDQAAESAMGMAEEHFAAALSASGGFGLTAHIERGLAAAPHVKSSTIVK
jgi:Rod binding domain-containing protein